MSQEKVKYNNNIWQQIGVVLTDYKMRENMEDGMSVLKVN